MSLMLSGQNKLLALDTLKAIAQNLLIPGVTPEQQQTIINHFRKLFENPNDLFITCKMEASSDSVETSFLINIAFQRPIDGHVH